MNDEPVPGPVRMGRRARHEREAEADDEHGTRDAWRRCLLGALGAAGAGDAVPTPVFLAGGKLRVHGGMGGYFVVRSACEAELVVRDGQVDDRRDSRHAWLECKKVRRKRVALVQETAEFAAVVPSGDRVAAVRRETAGKQRVDGIHAVRGGAKESGRQF
jgi:hypothetical protein